MNFFPTYKYDVGGSSYDTSKKQRVPSWADRVLYYAPREGMISQFCYNSCDVIQTSDHKPVVAGFRVHVQPSEQATSPVEAGEGESQVCTIA